MGAFARCFYYYCQLRLCFRKSIQVTGANNELLFLVTRCMPDEYRARITEVVKAAYPNNWDYAILGETEKVGFRADHFCFWNRYCENVSKRINGIHVYNSLYLFQGTDAPIDVHPSHLMRLCQDTGCPRRHIIPHLSQDIFEDGGRLYKQLTAGLYDVFSWLGDEVSIYLCGSWRSAYLSL